MEVLFGSGEKSKSRSALGILFGLALILASNELALASSPVAGLAKKPKPNPTEPHRPGKGDGQWVGFYRNDEGTPLIEMIESASSDLDIEIYEMTDKAVRTAIRKAITRGVRVRIVMEPNPVGGKCPVFGLAIDKEDATCKDLRALVREINSKHGKVVAFNKEELCGVESGKNGKSPNCFEHGKIVIKDSKIALISSGNFNPTNLCDADESPATCNRDYTVVTDDSEVVDGLEAIVENDLKETRYDVSQIVRGSLAQKLTVSPLSLQPLIDFIASAQESVDLQNQYLNDPSLNDALVAAARRGVKVSVMVSSACSFGRPTDYERAKVTKVYSRFDAEGIRSRFFTRSIQVNGVNGYLHAKAIVVDGRRAWVGSVNGSTTALTLNREFGLFFDRADWVTKLHSTVTEDLRNPDSESWEESLDCQKDFSRRPTSL